MSTKKGSKKKQGNSLSVKEFFERYGDELGLSLHGSDVGFERLIKEPTINRPGLALAGFFTYFAFRRIQVIGNSESSYLNNLRLEDRVKHFLQDMTCLNPIMPSNGPLRRPMVGGQGTS